MARRTGDGFRRVGAASLGGGTLPAPRLRELRLGAAWRRVAGEELARRVRPLRLVRGVVDLQVGEERWRRALEPLLPALAARLGLAEPALGIRRYRVCVAPQPARGRSEPLPDGGGMSDLPAAPAAGPPALDGAAARPPLREPAGSRLRELAGRYLRRAGERERGC